MVEHTSDVFAGLSLVISVTTAWLTLFRRGVVRMTQPAFIFFGPDGGGGRPKVAICTHLYCTAERGRIIESFYLRLTRGGQIQDFDVWVYGSEGLARGSGVYVGRDGVTCNHHFLLPKADDDFAFTAGSYRVEFFATFVGDARPCCLYSVALELPHAAAEAVRDDGAGLFFEWRPSSRRYQLSVDRREERLQRELRKAGLPLNELIDLMPSARSTG